MIGLTERMAECLAAIEALTVDGISPSTEELRLHLGLASKSNVHRFLVSLEDRGHIRRVKYRRRAIEIIPMAEREGYTDARLKAMSAPDLWLLRARVDACLATQR